MSEPQQKPKIEETVISEKVQKDKKEGKSKNSKKKDHEKKQKKLKRKNGPVIEINNIDSEESSELVYDLICDIIQKGGQIDIQLKLSEDNTIQTSTRQLVDILNSGVKFN